MSKPELPQRRMRCQAPRIPAAAVPRLFRVPRPPLKHRAKRRGSGAGEAPIGSIRLWRLCHAYSMRSKGSYLILPNRGVTPVAHDKYPVRLLYLDPN